MPTVDEILVNEHANIEKQAADHLHHSFHWVRALNREWLVEKPQEPIALECTQSSDLAWRKKSTEKLPALPAEYSYCRTAIETGMISVNDLSQLPDKLIALMSNLAYVWQDRFKREYCKVAKHKVLAGVGDFEGGFPIKWWRLWGWKWERAIKPTTGLTPELLSGISKQLQDQGIEKPVRLLTWSDVDCPGFIKESDSQEARWKIQKGRWIEVPPFVVINGVSHRNEQYDNAPFADAIVLLPEVVTFLHSEHHGCPADAKDYAGEIRWRNILDAVTNPDGTLGFFRAVLNVATKPVRPDLGWVIRYCR